MKLDRWVEKTKQKDRYLMNKIDEWIDNKLNR